MRYAVCCQNTEKRLVTALAYTGDMERSLIINGSFKEKKHIVLLHLFLLTHCANQYYRKM